MNRYLLLTPDEPSYRRAEAILAGHGVAAVAKLPPHLIEVGPCRELLPELSGCARVYEGQIPEADLEALPPAARMMARAIVSARSNASALKGEGLPWDSPGFVPPDEP